MTAQLQIYACALCDNVVEVVRAGKGELACCGQPMKLLTENTEDASREKHVPVVEKTAEGTTVTVGSVAHPMEEKHYIEWIQLIVPSWGKSIRKFLKPGDVPRATFAVSADDAIAREYCNLHGLWKKEASE